MKWRLFAVVSASVLLCAGGIYTDEVPPERFRGNAVTVVETVDDPHATCSELLEMTPPDGWAFKACYVGRVIYLPNPCKFTHEEYGRLACHEQAHANSWSRFHEP